MRLASGLLLAGLALPGPAGAEDAWERGGCALCHEVPGRATASRQDSCADCHAWVREVAADPARRARAMAVFPLWERYEQNVHSYLPVPSLEAALARLEPAWVERWLADPHDLRPGLPEGMPRFGLSAAERAELASAFGRVEVPPASAGGAADLAWGEALFVARGCASCHSLGGRHTEAVLPLAPDLAWTRERMRPAMVEAWIADPKAVSPAATMPALGLPPEEVRALRDYVLKVDPEARPAVGPAALPAPLERPVSWAEVEERVFGRICVHCHMDPAQNQGRAGPGNAGGFGWPASGVQLQTWEGVAAVADRIPAALARRRAEAARDVLRPGEAPADIARPERPGMPLGLPPLSDEDTALVLAWIEQGMPR